MRRQGGEIRVCGSTFTGNTGHGSGGGLYLWAYAPDRIIVERDVFKGNAIKPNDSGGVGLGGGARLSIGPLNTPPAEARSPSTERV